MGKAEKHQVRMGVEAERGRGGGGWREGGGKLGGTKCKWREERVGGGIKKE